MHEKEFERKRELRERQFKIMFKIFSKQSYLPTSQKCNQTMICFPILPENSILYYIAGSVSSQGEANPVF